MYLMNVYSIFKELARCFASHPLTAQKGQKIKPHFQKNFFEQGDRHGKAKKARHIPLWNATGATKKAHRFLGGLLCYIDLQRPAGACEDLHNRSALFVVRFS